MQGASGALKTFKHVDGIDADFGDRIAALHDEQRRYAQARDALAHDWAVFLAAALPGVAWMQLPNLGGEHIVPYCEQWEIDRLILSGGEDIGVSALRDQTELYPSK